MSFPKKEIIHLKFDPRKTMIEDGYVHVINVPWTNKIDGNPGWNVLCANVIEVFGLPGDRFVSHPKPQSMSFYFKSEKDAMLCQILLSDKL